MGGGDAYKVDTDNQLRFAPSRSLDLDSIVPVLCTGDAVGGRGRRGSVTWWSVTWRSSWWWWRCSHSGSRMARRISSSGGRVDGRRTAHHLRRRCTRISSHGTLRATSSGRGSVVICIARRSPTSTRVIHGERGNRGSGGRGCSRSRDERATGELVRREFGGSGGGVLG